MKLLWVKADFLHPLDRGGQIRTFETLRRLHKRHEVHYVGMRQSPEDPGPALAYEYSTRAYAVDHFVVDKSSAAFAAQVARGVFDRTPVAVSRYRSTEMQARVDALIERENFDRIVCDFLFGAANVVDLTPVTLFQHNVEALIWKRRAQAERNPLKRLYLQLQASRMERFEGEVCRSVRNIIAVSEKDASIMHREYEAPNVNAIPTGVDVDYFRRPQAVERKADLVFVGSMDWMPNIDGALWFVKEALPLIRERVPDCTLAIAGRRPTPELEELASRDSKIVVTGSVPDIRPWLWGSKVSIVPLRVGGGTRIKIYEAMAAGVPVVSTRVGAEGLDVANGHTILLEDDPERFARACAALLLNKDEAARIAGAALEVVTRRYSWDNVARAFERLLERR